MNIKRRANFMGPQRLSVAAASTAFSLVLVMISQLLAGEDGRFTVASVNNPRYRSNEMFRAFEDYHSPRIRRLRARYGL